MQRLLRVLFGVVLALVLVVSVGWIWKGEEVKRLLTVNTLFDEDKIVHNFSHMNDAFLNTELGANVGPASALPKGPQMALPDRTQDWIKERAVTSLIVIKDGTVRYEDYYLGTGANDRRISWSLAKSYLASLLGILIEEGAIETIDAPVTDFAPKLAGSAYEGATIRDVLQMSSGVVFDEDYLDKNSDINRMGRVIALGGELDQFTADLSESFAEPGEEWQYVSIDTHVIGMVIRGATGRSVPELLSEKLLQPLGLEQDGYYVTDGAGVAFVLGGLNFTTRDYARFANMILAGGVHDGQQIVPADWLAEATVASANTKPGKKGYGYQWWMPADATEGEFFGHGVYGQYLYFDTEQSVAIIATGADRGFKSDGVAEANIDDLRLIAASVDESS